MKVLVLNNRVPFVHGGAEELSSHLVRQLRIAGHQAEEMRIPFSWNPPERLADEMVIARNLKIDNVDRIISLKFPVYLAQHPCNVVWLLHQFRQAYDLHDAGMSDFGDDTEGRVLREAIRHADSTAFRSAHRLFAIREAAKRLKHYNGIEADILSAPLNDPELFRDEGSADYLFAGGRVNSAKRQSLLVEALQYAPGVRLVIAGAPETPGTEAELREIARRCGVEERVTFDLRFLPRHEIAALVNHCRAAVYIPFMEDSVGYVTMEAFQASKPAISTTDSGGVLDIVRNEETGLVVEPTPMALGSAMVTLYSNASYAQRLGRAARALLDERDYVWPKTIVKLLS